MYPPLELIHKRCTLSCSQSKTQVDVPSTCTTKDVPSNVLRQSSWAISPLKLCEGETKEFSGGQSFEIFCFMEREESKEFSDCVVLNSLTREKGDTKEFRRLVPCSFGKERRETQKEFRRLDLGKFFLAKGEENKKDEQHKFSRFRKPENFRKLLVQRRRRSSKRFKACKGLIGKAKVFKIVVRKIDLEYKTNSCFYRLFMSGQEGHSEEL